MLRNPRYRRHASALRSHCCPPFALQTVVSASQLANRYCILLYPVCIRSISALVGGPPPPPPPVAVVVAAAAAGIIVVMMRMAEVMVCASKSRREEDVDEE